MPDGSYDTISLSRIALHANGTATFKGSDGNLYITRTSDLAGKETATLSVAGLAALCRKVNS